MKIKKRSLTDLAIDTATANDTIKDTDISTAEVVLPDKKLFFKIVQKKTKKC